MTERWRRPLKPLAIEEDAGAVSYDGVKLMRGLDITYTPDDFQRLREGYACLNCQEPFEQPFPERCAVCGYAVRELQTADIAREFRGHKHLGSTVKIADELERLEEWAQRQEHVPEHHVLVPDGGAFAQGAGLWTPESLN
jgi:hypothetical protein